MAALNLTEIPDVKTYIIAMDAPGATGTYEVNDCDTRNNEVVDLVGSGLHAVNIRAAFGENGTVEGGEFLSDVISPLGYSFSTTVSLPTMVPQPEHDPSVYPD